MRPAYLFKLFERLYRHTISRLLARSYHRPCKKHLQPIVWTFVDHPASKNVNRSRRKVTQSHQHVDRSVPSCIELGQNHNPRPNLSLGVHSARDKVSTWCTAQTLFPQRHSDGVEFYLMERSTWVSSELMQRNKLPSYSMTSSARAKSEEGRVIPRAFAALRLMASSNLVGCSTAGDTSR
jgi:hypothetical protein